MEFIFDIAASEGAQWARAAGIIFGASIVAWFIWRLFRKIKEKLLGNKDRYLHGLSVRGYILLNPKQHVQVVLGSIDALRIASVLLVFYLMLLPLFRVFPQTELWTDTLMVWIITPIKAIGRGMILFIPKLITIVIIVVFVRYAIRLLRFVTREIEKGHLVISGFYREWAAPTFNIGRFLLFAFMFIAIFPYLPGSDSPVFEAVTIFLGVLISLGSSSAISNGIAGLVLVYMRSFQVGDVIKMGDVTGRVIEKGLLVTRLRTIKNEDITVPNSSVLSGHTLNYSAVSGTDGLILHTSVTIGYDVPWQKVNRLLIESALATEGILKDKTPYVFQSSLDDFTVAYQLNAFTDRPTEMAVIYSELHKHILDKFHAAGIEMISPRYQSIRDGNASTIPVGEG